MPARCIGRLRWEGTPDTVPASHQRGDPVRRLLLTAIPTIAATFALALITAAGTPPAGAATPTATPSPTSTPPPSPPGLFQGTITLFGKKPSGSVSVVAYVSGKECGSGKVGSGGYAVTVKSAAELVGCGTPGATVTFKVGDYWAFETGNWLLGLPQKLDLTGPKTSTTQLGPGCNNVSLTFANKTPIKTIREALNPPDNLTSIWKWNGKTSTWDGDFPSAPAALNTLKTVDRLDVVWMCVSDDANLQQPATSFQ
jgi:hypothetical protein